jgi:hypothetical protein
MSIEVLWYRITQCEMSTCLWGKAGENEQKLLATKYQIFRVIPIVKQ